MSDEQTPQPTHHKGSWPDFSLWAREVATRNVITPLQWVLAIVAAAALPGMVLAPDPWIRGGLFCLLVVCVGYVLRAYDYFRKTDPDKLQTESYRHAQSELAQQGKLLLDERRRADRYRTIDGTIVANPSVGLDERSQPQIANDGLEGTP